MKRYSLPCQLEAFTGQERPRYARERLRFCVQRPWKPALTSSCSPWSAAGCQYHPRIWCDRNPQGGSKFQAGPSGVPNQISRLCEAKDLRDVSLSSSAGKLLARARHKSSRTHLSPTGWIRTGTWEGSRPYLDVESPSWTCGGVCPGINKLTRARGFQTGCASLNLSNWTTSSRNRPSVISS